MPGRYLRVHEAAALLGVSPTTIHWYSRRGWLPTYRVGRGRVAHRRFRYADVQAVARRTGRFLGDEPRWDPTVPVTLDMAAEYLGLSARYLVNTGWVASGVVLTWDDLVVLERRIYVTAEVHSASNRRVHKEGESPMRPMMMERCGGGGRAHGGPHGGMRPGWPEANRPPEDASLMALRRTKRHLETQKADLEDQLAELEERIRLHPDNHDPS